MGTDADAAADRDRVVVRLLEESDASSVKRFGFEGMTLIGRVVDVYDVDTILVTVPAHAASFYDPGSNRELSTIRVRLLNIDVNHDVPVNGARDALVRLIAVSNGVVCSSSAVVSRQARQALFDANCCIVRLECGRFDKYGRVLAKVRGPDDAGNDFSTELVRGGWVSPYVRRPYRRE